jgi:acyl carrier protein phosphodiesterase
MNYLAHCALAGADEELVVGSYLGDFVKGLVSPDLPTMVQRGVRLHRRIDAYTNRQPDIKESVARFPAELRRIAPVFTDLIADHFLARDFERYYGESLAAFSRRTYRALDRGARWLTPDALEFRHFIENTDMFARYRNAETVERGFRRIAMRLRMPSTAAPASEAFRRTYDALGADFGRYFPDVQRHATAWLAEQRAKAAADANG